MVAAPRSSLRLPMLISNRFARDPQHSADSSVASDTLNEVLWTTTVDLAPQINGFLATHYGTPMITAADTVIVPVKTGATQGFRLDARDAADGSLIWTMPTDYILPASEDIPVFGPTLTAQSRGFSRNRRHRLFCR